MRRKYLGYLKTIKFCRLTRNRKQFCIIKLEPPASVYSLSTSINHTAVNYDQIYTIYHFSSKSIQFKINHECVFRSRRYMINQLYHGINPKKCKWKCEHLLLWESEKETGQFQNNIHVVSLRVWGEGGCLLTYTYLKTLKFPERWRFIHQLLQQTHKCWLNPCSQ